MHAFIALLFLAIAAPAPSAAHGAALGPHAIYAVVVRVAPGELAVQRRDGHVQTVDISEARALGRTGVLYAHRPVVLFGDVDRSGRFHANAIRSWYGLLHGAWPEDR